MKKLLLFLLLPVSLFAQLRDSVYWNTPYFIINYSETLEGPRSIRYAVACPNGTASRSGMDFYTEKDIKTSGIKIRGTGAATKGVIARGPMA